MRDLAVVKQVRHIQGNLKPTAKGATTVAKTNHWSAVKEPPAGSPIKLGSRPNLGGRSSYGKISVTAGPRTDMYTYFKENSMKTTELLVLS